MNSNPAMIVPAVLICLAVSAGVGLINGALVAYGRINSFIATLGTGLILQGILAASFSYMPGAVAPEFLVLAYGGVFGVSYMIIIFLSLPSLLPSSCRAPASAPGSTPLAAIRLARASPVFAPSATSFRRMF